MGFGIVWTLRFLHTSRWAVALVLRCCCAYYSTRVPLLLVPLVLLAMSSSVL